MNQRKLFFPEQIRQWVVRQLADYDACTPGTLFADNRMIEKCEGPLLIQTMRSSLAWLTEMPASRGKLLSANQIVLTGSIPSLIPIREDCGIKVDASTLGSVEVKFVLDGQKIELRARSYTA